MKALAEEAKWDLDSRRTRTELFEFKLSNLSRCSLWWMISFLLHFSCSNSTVKPPDTFVKKHWFRRKTLWLILPILNNQFTLYAERASEKLSFVSSWYLLNGSMRRPRWPSSFILFALMRNVFDGSTSDILNYSLSQTIKIERIFIHLLPSFQTQ